MLGTTLPCFDVSPSSLMAEFDAKLFISSFSYKQPIGYYCVAHHVSAFPSIHPKLNSGAGDTAKTTGPIYFIFFHGKIILSR